uniref:Chemokine interleukin-8-like domain-containing protein n=1 Tax=Cynoglossus semilaevis TaxID=244447 RepID=A0A3P8WK40_CYNSE
MDLKVAVLLVCLSTLSVIPTEATIPRCCVKTSMISRSMLSKVSRWEVQRSSGACDISALILYIRSLTKPVCAPLKLKALVEAHYRAKGNQLRKRF